MKFDFQLGTPFTPFQQLMGVLPEDSKEHVPNAYRVRHLKRRVADDRI
jgi:5'-3' exoribonuclease 1